MLIKTAAGFKERLIGLMCQSRPQHGLLLLNCKAVHTFFCKTPLDIFFLDKDGVVIKKVKNIKPWRLSPIIIKAVSVLEAPTYACLEIEEGEQIHLPERREWLLEGKIKSKVKSKIKQAAPVSERLD